MLLSANRESVLPSFRPLEIIHEYTTGCAGGLRLFRAITRPGRGVRCPAHVRPTRQNHCGGNGLEPQVGSSQPGREKRWFTGRRTASMREELQLARTAAGELHIRLSLSLAPPSVAADSVPMIVCH